MNSRWLVSLVLSSSAFATGALAQTAPALLQEMAGTWAVEQKMWTGPNTEATVLPASTAQRRLIDGKYLEETMQPRDSRAGTPDFFTRNAFLNYNAVTKQYEYVSIDTRAPQVMIERGLAADTSNNAKELRLQGGTFLAPEWGPAKNVEFTYRLTISAIRDGRQTVSLYLTPTAVQPKKEFLAFEYAYTRQR